MLAHGKLPVSGLVGRAAKVKRGAPTARPRAHLDDIAAVPGQLRAGSVTEPTCEGNGGD